MQESGRSLMPILDHLLEKRGFDFSGYRISMLERRIGRRLSATQCKDFQSYLTYLRHNTDEFDMLLDVLTICVSSFFRDPLTFELLAERILPSIIEEKIGLKDNSLRIWSAGCATGEEPYSVAILAHELLQKEECAMNLHIFATDIDANALKEAENAVLETIRSNPETRDLPVIVVTAKDLTADDKKKLAGNVFSLLEKSTAIPAILLQEIRRSLRNLETLQKQRITEKSSGRPRILLVEDNEVAIVQVQSFLESANYIADVARSAQEAFAYVARTIPDGIILDLMMPEIDGFAVLEKIRSTQATAQIPVLILTARDLTPEDLRRLSSNNVKQLVQKGDVDRKGLLDKIASLIAKKPTILIMEDNPDNMATFKAVLAGNYQVIEATDGEQGLMLVTKTMPDLILLDMALPRIDGFAVVGHLKSDLQLRDILVIAVTARVMKDEREKIMQAGCDDYIAKSIDPEQFVAKIDEWLKG